jgi:hypothetical protein
MTVLIEFFITVAKKNGKYIDISQLMMAFQQAYALPGAHPHLASF